jgi:hypothetical protein
MSYSGILGLSSGRWSVLKRLNSSSLEDFRFMWFTLSLPRVSYCFSSSISANILSCIPSAERLPVRLRITVSPFFLLFPTTLVNENYEFWFLVAFLECNLNFIYLFLKKKWRVGVEKDNNEFTDNWLCYLILLRSELLFELLPLCIPLILPTYDCISLNSSYSSAF